MSNINEGSGVFPAVVPSRIQTEFNQTANDEKKQKMRFWWFSLVASLNHALSYVVISYATSLLSPQLGGIILGLSWTLNAISGLSIATPIVNTLGFKYSMILSLFGYAIQLFTLYLAVVTPDTSFPWIVAITGNIISGFTSAVWWTSQGVYFEYVSQKIGESLLLNERIKSSNVDSIRAELSAHWTIIYQSADIIVFLSLSLFPLAQIITIDQVILCLVILGFVTTLLGFTFENIESDNVHLSWQQIRGGVMDVPNQALSDARVCLLAPFTFGFGISTAMFAYYVNSNVVSNGSNLGTVCLGLLEAFSYFIAILSAYPYALVSNHLLRGQDWVIQFGSLSFILSGAIVWSLNNAELGTWQNILIAKGFYGLGRGVFEGSCRAVYAKMFTGKKLATAFSSQTLSAGLSGGVCFFLFSFLSRSAIAAITVVNGIFAILFYFSLMYIFDPLILLPWGKVFASLFTMDADKTSLSDSYRHDSEPLNSDQQPLIM